MTKGAVYIAYGREARDEARISIRSLEEHNPDLPISVISNEPLGKTPYIKYDIPRERNRWAKLNLDTLSPYEHTLYIDADTRVTGRLTAGFAILDDGWDLAVALSRNQEVDWLWHCGEDDRRRTIMRLQYRGLQYGGGVLFFAKNDRMNALFAAWRDEWSVFSDQDQGALMRALYLNPVKLWVLGPPWNGVGLVNHRFGMARER